VAKSKNKITENELLDLPPLIVNLPLSGRDWVGGDGGKWRDVALDSSSEYVLAWLRRRLRDGKYFLIVSVVKGHVLAYEVTVEEAKELYGVLPNRAPYEKSFGKVKLSPVKKDEEAA